MSNIDPKLDAIKKKLAAAEIGKVLATKFSFAKDEAESLYVYQDGAYRRNGEAFVRKQVKQHLAVHATPRNWSSHLAEEVIRYLLVDAPVLWATPPRDVINVLNGLLNLSSLELTPHRPDFLSAVQLPVRYDPAATCEAWEGFLSATLPEDAVHLGYEIAAWAMSPGNTGQTAVLLLGSGANGKSVFLSALEAYLGRENVCSVSLQKLEGDRFSASRLMGKLANVCADIPSSRLVGTSVFKALTGGDLIWAEKKFKDAFDYRPFAKLIFSANQVPYTDDSTYGFLRRWLVVPFNRTFEIGSAGHIPRAELDAMLAQPQELSGVLNMAVAYWPLIQADGLSSPESCQQALEDFRSIADPIRAWLEREVEQDPKGCIAKRDLWERYADDCKTERRPPISQKAFAMAIRKAMPGLRETQRTIRDKRQEVYVGVRYRRAETLQS